MSIHSTFWRAGAAILASAVVLSAAAPASAFTREGRLGMETAFGHARTGGMEAGIEPRRGPDGSRTDVRSPFGLPSQTAIGNLINVQAGPHSTVILNALQINRGHQTTHLNGSLRFR